MTPSNDVLLLFNEESINIFCWIMRKDENHSQSCYIHTCNLFEVLDLIDDDHNKTKEKHLLTITPKLYNCYRSAILIDSRYKPYESNFYKTYSSKILLDYVPTNIEEFKTLNEKIKNNFSSSFYHDDDDNFYQLSQNFGSLNIKYESFPGGTWQNIFDNESIYRPFHASENNITYVEFMTRKLSITTLKTFFYPKLNSLFVNLPYTNGYSMLIIMPEEILNKDQLIQFCDNHLFASDIEYFYQIGGEITEYNKVYFPKLNFNTQISLFLGDDDDDDDDHHYCCSSSENCYIKMFYNSYPNFSKISRKLTNLKNRIQFSFYSSIKCYENGSMSINKDDNNNKTIVDDDDDDTITHQRILNIDRNFVFAYMDENQLINGFGFFINDDDDDDE